MEDPSQGSGWWLATDGNWYPPETHPAFRPHLPHPGAGWWLANDGKWYPTQQSPDPIAASPLQSSATTQHPPAFVPSSGVGRRRPLYRTVLVVALAILALGAAAGASFAVFRQSETKVASTSDSESASSVGSPGSATSPMSTEDADMARLEEAWVGRSAEENTKFCEAARYLGFDATAVRIAETGVSVEVAKRFLGRKC